MKHVTSFYLGTMVVLVLATALSTLHIQEQTESIEVAEPLSYARVYSDAAGESHFADEQILFKLIDYAPPAPPISVSEVMIAENVSFLSSPSGWFGDWHPAPRRQFVIVLSGELEIEVSDGEKRRFGPGGIALVEDTAGKGHISRVVSKKRGYCVAVPLGDK